MNESLLPTRFLFRFSAPCLHREAAARGPQPPLGEEFRLLNLAELDSRPTFADMRVCWNHAGLTIGVRVSGKKHALWCREHKREDSDGLQLWIDTRDTHNIHRASRFCHRFSFLPAGGGRNYDEPVADQLLVDRARENAQPIRPGALDIQSTILKDGYDMTCYLPAAALTGYQPDDHPKLGFTYYLFDREFGEQTFSLGSEFPFAADPSLWGTLELVKP